MTVSKCRTIAGFFLRSSASSELDLIDDGCEDEIGEGHAFTDKEGVFDEALLGDVEVRACSVIVCQNTLLSHFLTGT